MCGFKSLFLKVHSSKAAFVGHFDRVFPKKWNLGLPQPHHNYHFGTIIAIGQPKFLTYRVSPIIASLVSQSLSQSLSALVEN